jgi:hypothetical protein
MDGSVDGINPSVTTAVPADTPPSQEHPDIRERKPESVPVNDDSGKTLDLYV